MNGLRKTRLMRAMMPKRNGGISCQAYGEGLIGKNYKRGNLRKSSWLKKAEEYSVKIFSY